MNRSGLRAGLTGLFLPLALGACSSSGDDGGAAPGSISSSMYIEQCSLGCNNGSSGEQIGCTISSIFVNQEIAITFSQPVAESSLTPSSVRMFANPGGDIPLATRRVDPNNARRVLFRPALTFVDGLPQFELDPDTIYEFRIPGVGQGDSGPYVRSVTGEPNQTRLRCTVRPNLGETDLVPGPPEASVTVDIIDVANNQILFDQPADGATNVWTGTQVVITFNDVMNPATLASGGQSTYIRTVIDNDGDLLTIADQVVVAGQYAVDVDLDELETTLTFIPETPLPSSGDLGQRKIFVDIPADVRDLVDNPVVDPGMTVFQTQQILFPPTTIEEDFATTDKLRTESSGAEWGTDMTLGPHVGRGLSGGSGRLGELVVRSLETVTLSTDNQEFPLLGQAWGLLDNFDYTTPGGGYDPADSSTWPRITVTDGVFEFERLIIQPGGVLRFEGSIAARVLVRGEARIDGTLDVSGESPISHRSSDVYGGEGGAGGPAAGSGGIGATRFNQTGQLGPDGPASVTAKGVGGPDDFDEGPAVLDGGTAEGVGGVPHFTRGLGGVHYPPTFPTMISVLNLPADGLTFTYSALGLCRSAQVAGPGGGGAHNSNGTEGVPDADPPLSNDGDSNVGASTPGGTSSGFLDDAARSLDPALGVLRGGAGGGGGGASILGTSNSVVANSPCISEFFDLPLTQYYDHSGAAGGGGGGALQLAAGRRILLNGIIDAGGGDGGSARVPEGDIQICVPGDCGQFAAPGGAGAGGGVRLLSKVIDIAPLAGRIDVSGGSGGQGATGSVGGDGGYGLVRIEDMPDDPLDDVVFAEALASITPSVDSPTEPVLTIAEWTTPRARPESFSGATSCWYKPDGSFFELAFDEDTDPTDPDQQGWNMVVLYDAGQGLQAWPYRGVPNDPLFPLGMSFEDALGNTVNQNDDPGVGSFMSIRFQGGRLKRPVDDLCDVELSGPDPDIATNSLTPWVSHPADLNLFFPAPNMIRFAIMFDTSMLLADPFNRNLKGFTSLTIGADPD